MFRYPDVSRTHIAFVYAGDIWVVPKTGGTASRLGSLAGEEQMPRCAADGMQIPFSGNCDGNMDVYVVPAMGTPGGSGFAVKLSRTAKRLSRNVKNASHPGISLDDYR
jgi:tricorn protease-like protein